MLNVYNRRVVTLLIAFPVILALIGAFKTTIGAKIYLVSFVALCVVTGSLIWYEVRRQIPEGVGASDEQTLSLRKPYEKACDDVVKALEICRWKTIEANPTQGHFKAKIGRTIYTYGQLFTVDVKRTDALSSSIHVRCEALHQLLDYGQNNKRIQNFMSELLTTRESYRNKTG